MPTIGVIAPPLINQRVSIALTPRPLSAAPGGLARRHWNTPPPGLFPPETRKPSMRRPMSAAKTARPSLVSVEEKKDGIPPRKDSRARAPAAAVSPMTTGRRLTATQQPPRKGSIGDDANKATAQRLTGVAEAQLDAIARSSPRRLSQVTWNRLQKANDNREATQEAEGDRQKQPTLDQELDAAVASRRDTVRSAQVRQTLKKRDVDAEDVRPLIEIAYWSPFLEVRRDAAAALASLSRNPANLELLSDVGTLGALISMLSAGETKTDPAIACDCAQTLVSMAKLDAIKLKLLQAPGGLECVFGLLHSHDLRLRRTAFELVKNLVTTEELRLAVAKREGFAYLLECCTSKDARIRFLAAAILHHLAESPENRFLFSHTSHFQTLATILLDPFIERDPQFRRELLACIHLLVAEEASGRHMVELNMVPTLLLILDSPKATHAICVLVVSILEAVSSHRKNHGALIDANAVPKLVHLCFCSSRGVSTTAEKRPPALPQRRPQTASGTVRVEASSSATRVSMVDMALLLPMVATVKTAESASASTTALPSAQQSPLPVVVSSEVNALLRPTLTVFCELAKNDVNRDPIIRSKVVDYITARSLYAASDKRVRRSVMTLLTLLISRDRDREHQSSTPPPTSDSQSSTTHTLSRKNDCKHYIELLARGIIKCLFGILCGNDFSMKVDAIAAIAQLTEDTHSRITMCKPPLLRSLEEFAFHPLIQTRTNIARIIANFSERPENILKLMDEGMLAILVKYVCPIARNNDVLVEATRAIASMSMIHVARNKLVESGVLGTLLQFCKTPSTSSQVHANATIAIRNLRHDAAALCIQSIYRGWCVRVHTAHTNTSRRRRARKLASMRKIPTDQAMVAIMERFVTGSK